MRSFSVQIIAVIGMILALVLAIKFWNGSLPSIPEMSSMPSFNIRGVGKVVPIDKVEPRTAPVSKDGTPQPIWVKPPQPTASDYPQDALDAGVSGVASVTCTAEPSGRVSGCMVIAENPSQYGFGEAAIDIVSRGRLTPFSPEHEPVEFTVRVPFNLGE